MLWPIAQVLDSWPHQRHNRCKTRQLVSKWEECQPWFLQPKEWKINNNHFCDSWSSCFIPEHFTERPLGPAKKLRARSQDTWTLDLYVEDLGLSWDLRFSIVACDIVENSTVCVLILSVDPPTLGRKAENAGLLFYFYRQGNRIRWG